MIKRLADDLKQKNLKGFSATNLKQCRSSFHCYKAMSQALPDPLTNSDSKSLSVPDYGPTKIQDYINEYRVEGEYCLIGEDGDHFLKWQNQPMIIKQGVMQDLITGRIRLI